MSEPANTAPPSRDRTLRALHSLYVASLPYDQRARMLRLAPDLGDDQGVRNAADTLAASNLDPVQRCEVISRTLDRRDLLSGHPDNANAMVAALAPDLDDDTTRADVLRGLQEYAAREPAKSRDLRDAAFRPVLRNVPRDHGLVSAMEAGNPGCNDDPDPGDPGTIVSRFWSAASMQQLTKYVDPQHWVELGSPYWLEMTPVVGPRWDRGRTSYTATFKEVVAIPPSPITAYLDVRFTSLPDRFALTEFWATRDPDFSNEDIVTDEGCVFATTETPGDEPQRPNLVYAAKLITFRQAALNEFTGLACDNGWVDLMIKMAGQGGRRPELPDDPARQRVAAPGTGPLDQWAGSFKELIDATTVVSRRLVSSTRNRSTSSAFDDLLGLTDRSVDTFGLGLVAAHDLLHRATDRRRRS